MCDKTWFCRTVNQPVGIITFPFPPSYTHRAPNSRIEPKLKKKENKMIHIFISKLIHVAIQRMAYEPNAKATDIDIQPT